MNGCVWTPKWKSKLIGTFFFEIWDKNTPVDSKVLTSYFFWGGGVSKIGYGYEPHCLALNWMVGLLKKWEMTAEKSMGHTSLESDMEPATLQLPEHHPPDTMFGGCSRCFQKSTSGFCHVLSKRGERVHSIYGHLEGNVMDIHVPTPLHIYIYVYIYICMYIYICIVWIYIYIYMIYVSWCALEFGGSWLSAIFAHACIEW